MLPQDPYILLSLANTKLRDGCADLDTLADALDVAPAALTETLSKAGYAYDPATNQFKPI